MAKNTTIEWPKTLQSRPDMNYDSIEILYSQPRPDICAEQMAFAVACSKNAESALNCKNCIHKLEVTASPDFAQANMRVTHEVIPGLGAATQIIKVNDELRVASFDSGAIIPIKNFGPKKTFNSDVRGRLQHHCSPINCIASDSNGTQLASGSTDGEISLYQVRGEDVTFLSRCRVSQSFITGLAYFRPSAGVCSRPKDDEVLSGENMLVYAAQNGRVGLVDTRCALGDRVDSSTVFVTEPRVNISTICHMNKLPGHVVFIGTVHGHVMSIDLRYNKGYIHEQQSPNDGIVARMKQVVLGDETSRQRTFLAYTNESTKLQIYDAETMKPSDEWTSDRKPGSVIRDFCQVGSRLVTCGAHTSIGCWTYNPKSN